MILSAPSGGGKTTVLRELRKRDRSLRYSVSCTTRPPRKGEKDGTHYRFLSVRRFKSVRARRGFLEWAQVHDNYYGTPKDFIDRETKAGRVVLLDIDVQGAAIVRRKRCDCVSVFILPPSLRELEKRLRGRRDTDDTLPTRLRNARAEIRRAREFDYWVVNDRVDAAVREVEAIIQAERLRAKRQARESLRRLLGSGAGTRIS